MSDETYRDRWVAEVFRTPHVSDAVRVALLALGRKMDEDGMVSISEEELSSMIGRSERRTRSRIKTGIDSGFVERVARGQRNGRSRYRGTFPNHPSTGHPGVLKSDAFNRTPGGPEEKFQPDTLQPVENRSQPDTRGSSRGRFDPSVFRTPGGPEETAPIYKARAHAHSNGDRSDQYLQDEQTQRSVSQSAQQREAHRWLNARYHDGLTESMTAAVVEEVRRRASGPIRSMVPYLDRMAEGDLADIIGAAMDAHERQAPPPLKAVPDLPATVPIPPPVEPISPGVPPPVEVLDELRAKHGWRKTAP